MKLLIIALLLTASVTNAGAQGTAPRTGEYTAASTILELLGASSARIFEEKIPITEPVEWEIYVPGNYDPAVPPGVLVFINSRNTGVIPAGWKAVMDANNLIWIGANGSGNDASIATRVAYAILAPKLVSNSYGINPERVYVSGFSGGGRVSSLVATEYNDIFKGAIFNSGVNFWGEAASSRYREMTGHRYVFITGTEDFNLEDTRQVHKAFIDAGVANSKLMVIPGMSHERPGAGALDAALEYLDSRVSGTLLETE